MGDRLDRGGDLEAAEVRPPEYVASIWRRGQQRDRNRHGGVKSNSFGRNGSRKRSLLHSVHSSDWRSNYRASAKRAKRMPASVHCEIASTGGAVLRGGDAG